MGDVALTNISQETNYLHPFVQYLKVEVHWLCLSSASGVSLACS